MTRSTISMLALATACLALPATAPAASAPLERALYQDGPAGRHLLGKGWTTRADPKNEGLRAGWQLPGATGGFKKTTVPSAFNVGDLTKTGFRSRVQWYRVRFRLPERRGVCVEAPLRVRQPRGPGVLEWPRARYATAARICPFELTAQGRSSPAITSSSCAWTAASATRTTSRPAPAARLVELRRHPPRGLPAPRRIARRREPRRPHDDRGRRPRSGCRRPCAT